MAWLCECVDQPSYASNSLCKGTGSGSEKSKASGSGTTLADVEELIAEKNQALQKQHQLMQKQEKVILLFLKNIWVRGHSQMMSEVEGGLAKFWPKEGRLRGFGIDKGRSKVAQSHKI